MTAKFLGTDDCGGKLLISDAGKRRILSGLPKRIGYMTDTVVPRKGYGGQSRGTGETIEVTTRGRKEETIISDSI